MNTLKTILKTNKIRKDKQKNLSKKNYSNSLYRVNQKKAISSKTNSLTSSKTN